MPPARGSISSRKRRLELRTQIATGLEGLARPSSAALIFDAQATLPKQAAPLASASPNKKPADGRVLPNALIPQGKSGGYGWTRTTDPSIMSDRSVLPSR